LGRINKFYFDESGFFANFAGKINEMTATFESRISFVLHSQKSMFNGSICHPATFFFRYLRQLIGELPFFISYTFAQQPQTPLLSHEAACKA
jgi:hypothetical protein